ncbi:MAG: DUF5675 family protein [Algibacter sp.]|uniref:DUF5675 family protein n=1 Tax=Algibacter sp. TaxID=1872428 RepID=UPI0026024D5F|nr:DUF5675 family protein [Algibacter sp.]MDG1729436.1 DUF5675 family protein [Algibacter sp.]
MELTLYRAYFNEGTNGTLFRSGKFLCHTIELPWKNNKRNISCIPEGVYQIEPRFSKRFQHHLILKAVKGRSYILFHPANNALKELEGCIAPVIYLSGIGKGIYSRNAMQKLLSLVYQAKDRKETILLTIKSQNYESSRTL